MADDNNQDMAMEDILSSIKNILEDDEASHNEPESAPIESEAQSETAVQITEELPAAEDIMDLSPEMRVLDAAAAETPAEISAPVSETENDVMPDIDALLNTPEETGDILGDVLQTVGTEDLDSDPFYEEPEDLPAEVEEIYASPAETDAPVAEPEIPEEEPETEQETVAEDNFAEPEENLPEEQEYVSEPEPEVLAEPEYTPQEEPEYVVEEAETVAEAPLKAPETNAVDVSASIISNFAKMFNKEDETIAAPVAAAETVLPSEPVNLLGNGAKTIEDVVAGVIRNIIGSEVSQNWRQGADYDAFARDEIIRQTKAWLDENLPRVVEAVVKQEIERVMAKAGAHQ